MDHFEVSLSVADACSYMDVKLMYQIEIYLKNKFFIALSSQERSLHTRNNIKIKQLFVVTSNKTSRGKRYA